MNRGMDEEEHSIEMQLPYLAHIFKNNLNEVKFIPIMVGTVNEEKEAKYAKILKKYLQDEQTIFVISSDFW
jgi:AmmeMemoRadiSam system protein B